MINGVGLCIDSNSQITADLVARFGVEVVPLTITLDGVDYLGGIELDADRFFAAFATGATPTVATAQPSPGRFLAAYEALAERGAHTIVSVHLGAAVSGTVNSARVAAGASPIPVHVVDSGTASFGVACALWEAAEALESGLGIDDAIARATSVAERSGNVFVVGGLELARAGGRLDPSVSTNVDGVPVLALTRGRMHQVGVASTADDAVAHIARYIIEADNRPMRVAIGMGDRATAPLCDALEALLRESAAVNEIVRYRVGPSVAAHTGPGTMGAFFYSS